MTLRPRMIELGVTLRNPQTGQFSGAQVIPSPAAMKSAYARRGGFTERVAATAHALPTVREIGAATGTTAQRKFPLGIGAAARAETESIARTIQRFLISKR